jgi:hypothetical protein
MEELQEKHPLSLAEGVTPASPESTVVMRLGSHEVTVADVRRWALLEPNPQAALEWLLSPPGLASQMERNLLIAEMKATGQIDNPEMWRRLREVQRYEETERLIREAEQRSGAPIDDQALRRFWHERRSDYEQTLFAVETVWVPSAALARVAQSDVRYDHLAAAREIRDLLADGIGPDAVRLRMGVPELEHQRWERAMRRDLPSGIHETIASVQPGEWSEVRMTPSGALLVHLMDRYRGVPPLESTLPEVRRDFARSQAPERPLQERLLEEHDYRLVIDPSRLRWTDEGELTVIDAPEEGTETE